jgi:hypothetical protein
MKIVIKTIPHNTQHYPTIGDWIFMPDGNLIIKVSDMNNWKYEALVGVHELIESLLCKDKGIKDQDVTAFDIAFEKNRIEGNLEEPGDQLNAPYHQQHQFATSIEKEFARALGVDWDIYDKHVDKFN